MRTLPFYLLLFSAVLRLNAQAPVTVIKAARMFDGKGDRLIEPGLVVISGGRIQSVGGSAPLGAKVIDLGDATLLPGFIDAHTHLTMDFDLDYNAARLKALDRTTAESAIRATVNARKTLMAGFTTVRDLGSQDFLDVGLRNSINTGVVPGPRMLVSVHALGGTGGHCDGGAGIKFGLLNHESGPEDGVINSPDQARYAVRWNIKYGADIIKTCATGGVLSPTDDVDVPQLSQGELEALVTAAHELRRKTAAMRTDRKAPNALSGRGSIPLSTAHFSMMRPCASCVRRAPIWFPLFPFAAELPKPNFRRWCEKKPIWR